MVAETSEITFLSESSSLNPILRYKVETISQAVQNLFGSYSSFADQKFQNSDLWLSRGLWKSASRGKE